MNNKTCGQCKFHCKSGNFCSHHGTPWLTESNGACKDFEPIPKRTVFQNITTSPEVLAKDLVYFHYGKYHSTIVPGVKGTYKKAYDATLAKLKEVAE